MDQILASIRQMISDDEGSASQPQPSSSSRLEGNVSRLFAEGGPPDQTEVTATPAADNVVEIAIDRAMEDARVEVAAEAAVEAAVSAPTETTPEASNSVAVQEAEEPQSQPLM